jgi:subtilisin
MNKKMKYVRILLLGVFVFVTIFSIGFRVYATEATVRYHFKTENTFMKGFVGVQHEFAGRGFTTDLTPGQLKAMEWLINYMDVEVTEVPQYFITQSGRGIGNQISSWAQSVMRPSTPAPARPEAKPENPGKSTEKGGDKDGSEETEPVRRLYAPSSQIPWGIHKMYNNAGITTTSGGADRLVAVLDTGVYIAHLDLNRRVAQCLDFTRRGVKNGCDDGNGHGTHVAGTILADGGADSLGIYGVAPQASLLAYKVCGSSGSCWADDIAKAIQYAADQGADIISMSLGSSGESPLIRDAITYAVERGVLIVAAAGNSGPADGSINYPGANAKVIAVGAFDRFEQVPTWSSRGINNGDRIITEREVEFAGPGVAVESSWRDGSYVSLSGTSMATPHIAGLAAKLWQGSASATRAYLQGIARDIWTVGDDTATGLGFPSVR